MKPTVIISTGMSGWGASPLSSCWRSQTVCPVVVLAESKLPDIRAELALGAFEAPHVRVVGSKTPYKGFTARRNPSFFAASEHIALANEADERVELVGLENEFTVDAEGWVKIAPYGDSLKVRQVKDKDGNIREERFVQRLDKKAAEEMVRQSKTLFGRLKRFFVGIPIYKRHPDLAVHQPQTVTALANDKAQYGMFAEIAARDDGFYGRPVVSQAAQLAIENEGLKYLSPFWWVKPTGELKDGVPVVAPTELISAGLTDRPNIAGGDALANEKQGQSKPNSNMNRDQLLAFLAGAGIAVIGPNGTALANEAITDQAIFDTIRNLSTRAARVTALENEINAQTTARTSAENILKAAGITVTPGNDGFAVALANECVNRVKNAGTALANERKAHIKTIIDQAIKEGRITEAKRSEWETALSNETEFESKRTALANEKPTVKTTSVTGAAGERKGEQDTQLDLSAQALALANERMTKHGEDFDTAWARVKEANPALFEQMQQPAHAKAKS